jgi:hypothetical protein
MNVRPLTVQHSIAEHYFSDSRDFAARFDTLWEDQLHKTGRIKSFVDLVMGCECALKSHIFLGRREIDPVETYIRVRRAGHDIGSLCQMASYLDDRSLYDRMIENLAPFSVFIRYSLDAYATFFPTVVDWDDAPIRHATTIGSNAWVLSIRGDLDLLIESCSDEFTGVLNAEIEEILNHEQEMEAFMRRVAPGGRWARPHH